MFVRINQRNMGHDGADKLVWFVLQTDHPSIEAVHDTLVRDGRVYGIRINTRPGGNGRRTVIDASKVSLLADTITSVSEMVDDLYDADGTAIWIMPFDQAEAS